MNLFKSTVNISRSIRLGHHNQGLASLLPKQYSTAAEAQNQSPSSGVCYARLRGAISKYTTRSDVCNLLDGCNLNLDDIRIDYNRSFLPTSMLIQFPSRDAYEVGLKATRRDRLHRLDLSNRSAWGTIKAYGGRSILLEGVPRTATPDDVERFLSGCQYDPATIQNIYTRTGLPELVRIVTVSFPSPALAMHACITKDRGFCLNKQISVRVLQ